VSTEKHGKLVELLVKRTLEGTLEWKISVLDDRYQVSFRDNTVRIYESEDRETGSAVVVIELINELGTVAEAFNDEDLDRDLAKGTHYWFKQLKRLFETARRSALGSDKILDEILSDLDDDVPL
jgi:hypothetical protein